MATKIVTKNSSTASAVPTASDLVQGELAVNVADKRLFTEDNAGAIVELGTNPSALTVTGNVGVGTSSPRTLINASSSTGAILTLESSDTTLTANGVIGGIDFYSNDSSTNGAGAKVNIRAIGQNSSGTATALTFGTSSSGSATAVEAMRIDASGNVGIGTSSPSTKLHLGGTAPLDSIIRQDSTASGTNWEIGERAAGKWQIWEDDSDSVVATFMSSGNVGIGTSSPTFTLEVNGGGAADNLKVESQSTLTNFYQITTGGTTVFQNNNGNMAMFTGGAERMRIDASGNVGIGTSAIDGRLEIKKATASNETILGIEASGVTTGTLGSITYDQSDDSMRLLNNSNFGGTTLRLGTRGADNLVINYSGNVGIGTSSPTDALVVEGNVASPHRIKVSNANASGKAALIFTQGTTVKSWLEFDNATGIFDVWQYTNNPLRFGTNNTERMRIDASGNLLVGTTSTADTDIGAKIFSDARMVQGFAGTGLVDMHDFYRGTAGTLTRVGNIRTNGSSTTYNTSSDQRLKENIQDADDAGSKIDAIQVRKFDWKVDGSHQDYGMIAQELQAVAPEAVSVPEDSEEMMGVDYSKLVPMLIKEIQSLRNRVAQLEE